MRADRLGLDALGHRYPAGQSWVPVAKDIPEESVHRNDHLLAPSHGHRMVGDICMYHDVDPTHLRCTSAIHSRAP